MSLLTKIRALFTPAGASSPEEQVEKELAQLRRDDRLHQRHSIQVSHMAHLEIGGIRGELVDVSYGGLAVKLDAPLHSFERNEEGSLAAKMRVLGRLQDVRLTVVRILPPPSALVGFAVIHDKPETLLFLRDMIEPLRCGRSLVEIGQQMRHERYRGADWHCLRGDGPTDIIVKMTDGQLSEALLTFQLDGTYCDLSLKTGVLRTGRMSPEQGSKPLNIGGLMSPTAELDPALLRHACFVLAGVGGEHRNLCEPLLKLIMEHIERNLASTSAA